MKYVLALALMALTSCKMFNKDEAGPAPTPAHLVGWDYHCHKLTSVEGANVCLHAKGKPSSTLWYFHGAGCNQDVLQNAKTCIPSKDGTSEKELMTKLDNVTVVTLSFGPIWLVDPTHPKEKGTADPDATIKNFTEKILPEIDRLAGGALPRPFKGIGHSMGGFNLGQLALNTTLFEATVLVHPFIPDCDVFSDEIINEDCLPDMLLNFSPLIAEPAFKKKHWKAIDLLVLAKTATTSRMLVMATNKDEFGLFTGPKAFATLMMARGQPVYLAEELGHGTHYEYSVPTVIGFLK